jgi:hypothetical protein
MFEAILEGFQKSKPEPKDYSKAITKETASKKSSPYGQDKSLSLGDTQASSLDSVNQLLDQIPIPNLGNIDMSGFNTPPMGFTPPAMPGGGQPQGNPLSSFFQSLMGQQPQQPQPMGTQDQGTPTDQSGGQTSTSQLEQLYQQSQLSSGGPASKATQFPSFTDSQPATPAPTEQQNWQTSTGQQMAQQMGVPYYANGQQQAAGMGVPYYANAQQQAASMGVPYYSTTAQAYPGLPQQSFLDTMSAPVSAPSQTWISGPDFSSSNFSFSSPFSSLGGVVA